MRDHFPKAFDHLMEWEGGGVFHKVSGDKGGATNWGYSLRFMKGLPVEVSDLDRNGHVTENDVAMLTEETAKSYCRRFFWFHYKLDQVKQFETASKMLNMFFHMRGRVAGRAMQRALACCGQVVREDGIVGVITRDAINDLTSTETGLIAYQVALKSHQESVYRLIVSADPKQAKFLKGWLRRARDLKH